MHIDSCVSENDCRRGDIRLKIHWNYTEYRWIVFMHCFPFFQNYSVQQLRSIPDTQLGWIFHVSCPHGHDTLLAWLVTGYYQLRYQLDFLHTPHSSYMVSLLWDLYTSHDSYLVSLGPTKYIYTSRSRYLVGLGLVYLSGIRRCSE